MSPQPLIFGEVLFDRFPDGSAVLGGAPFNVAWHLQGFGFEPVMISRVGADMPGQRVLEAMERWGLTSTGVQKDSTRPTGAVDVTFEAGLHSFDILEGQAYDFIDADVAVRVASSVEPVMLYHGTLAARAPTSREALERLLAIDGVDVVVDINLRDPYWRCEDLPPLLERARWCKLNDDEVRRISTSLDVTAPDLEGLATAIQRRFELELLVVTCGAEGAMALAADGRAATVIPDETVEVVDTVGAGDAFASVVLAGIMSGWPIEATLRRAQSFASAICGVRGATVSDKAFYDRHGGRWSESERS
jgi:fructokinase